MSVSMERRTLAWKVPAAEVRAAGDGAKRLTGYFAVFNRYSQDLGGWVEQIAPGAFTQTIREADIYGLKNHDSNLVLGRNTAGTMRLAEDVTGGAYDIDLNPLDGDAMNTAAQVERGDMTGSSFGFRAIEVSWSLTDQDYPLRTVLAAKLYDVGPVTFPAYLATQEAGASAEVASRALLGLAESTGTHLDDLIAAAEKRELRSFIPGHEPSPVQHTSSNVAILRRRLELLAK